jgi:hypothetical protein
MVAVMSVGLKNASTATENITVNSFTALCKGVEFVVIGLSVMMFLLQKLAMCVSFFLGRCA